MNILMVHSERDEKYGAVHSMLEMLTILNKKYNINPILLISKEGNVSNYCRKMNWKYYITGHTNFMVGASTKTKKILRTILLPLIYLRYKIKNAKALKIIDKQINFNNIDLIHTNSSVCDIGAILSNKYDIPHVWHLREIGNLGYNRISLRSNYIDFMNNNTNKFIAISNVVKDKWHEMGLLKDKIDVIYNGVDIINYDYKEKNNDIIKMIIMGSISEQKGQYLLIDAINKLDDNIKNRIKLDIIGDGSYEYVKALKNKVNNYNLDNIISFLGYNSDVRKILNEYDIGFICSKAEGFGRVAIEYMMAKLCVISSNKGALKEIITDSYNGIFFNYPDTDDLKNKIEKIINNIELRNNIVNNAYNDVINKYTSVINAANIYNLYKKVKGDINEDISNNTNI